MREYAVYKGDSLICIGTVQQCAEYMEVKADTILFYTMPAYQRRVEKRKNPRNYISVIELDED